MPLSKPREPPRPSIRNRDEAHISERKLDRAGEGAVDVSMSLDGFVLK
jgi:hypothetical protein